MDLEHCGASVGKVATCRCHNAMALSSRVAAVISHSLCWCWSGVVSLLDILVQWSTQEGAVW